MHPSVGLCQGWKQRTETCGFHIVESHYVYTAVQRFSLVYMTCVPA